MSRFIVYDRVSGAIEKTVECPDSLIELQFSEGQGWLHHTQGVSDDTHYVGYSSQGHATIRMKYALDVDVVIDPLEVTILGLPRDTEVSYKEHSILSDEDPTVLGFDCGGKKMIRINPPVKFVRRKLEVDLG